MNQRTRWVWSVVVLSGAVACSGCASEAVQEGGGADAPAREVVGLEMVSGVLRGDIMAIGAETTGWGIVGTEDGTKLPLVEVDCGAIMDEAARLEGRRVKAWGRWEVRRGVERGEVRVFVVRSLVECTPGGG